MRQAVRLSREIFAQPAFDPFNAGEMLPGPNVNSDSELDAFIRAYADSAYHPSCTCKMGSTDDDMAVVDSSCKVIGEYNFPIFVFRFLVSHFCKNYS